ncbi:MAG: hypothetical protein JNM38_11790 [Acidobacteria bacterium]|nr:hypothetical protein [Acidobacteriota bacterium]
MTPVTERAVPPARLARMVALLLIGGTMTVLVRHALHYFFLIDDYALVGEGLTTPIGSIVSQPLFGFYRPVAFLFVHLETAAYSWGAPWAFATTSIVLHGVNAVLVGALTRQVSRDADAAWLATGVFFASPWSAEAFLWASGRFDLLACLGVLATLVVACWARERGGRLAIALPLTFAFTLASSGSKEHAVMLPVLIAGLGVLVRQPPEWRRRLLIVATVSATAVMAYLVVRQSVLPGLGGAYGRFGDLVSQTDIARALVAHAHALLWWPLPTRDPLNGFGEAMLVAPALAIGVPALAWYARRQAGALLTSALLVAVTLAPVLWAPPSGRFLYLPGVWLALGAGVAAATWLRPTMASTDWVSSVARFIVPFFLIGYALASLHTQAGWWERASSIARSGIASFAPWIDRDVAAVHIENLPFRCVEGPVVLTSYAFAHYYRGHQVPSIRATAHMVQCDGRQVEWLTSFPDPLTFQQQPQPGEQIVRLDFGERSAR